MRDGGEIGSDLEREECESARVERLIDGIGWKIQASRDLPLLGIVRKPRPEERMEEDRREG